MALAFLQVKALLLLFITRTEHYYVPGAVERSAPELGCFPRLSEGCPVILPILQMRTSRGLPHGAVGVPGATLGGGGVGVRRGRPRAAETRRLKVARGGGRR